SVTASPPGLDLDALARYLESVGVELEQPISGSVIPGGRSNLTYMVNGGSRRIVVRRPPLAHVLPTAHDMAREYRVLAALQGTGIPVPILLAHCADESVIGAPFYVMEHVEGHIVFAPSDPAQVVAVLDWEMSTIGDPLCDRGLLLVYWAESRDDIAGLALHGGSVTVEDGFFSRKELIDAYTSQSRRDLSSLDWY